MHGHKVTKFIYLTVFLILKNNIVHLLIFWCISQYPVRREGAIMLEPTCLFLYLLNWLQMQLQFRGQKYEMTSQSSLCVHACDVPPTPNAMKLIPEWPVAIEIMAKLYHTTRN